MANNEENISVSWHELPFYRSLSEQVLVFGVPRSVIMLNALVAFLFIINFHFFYILPISLLFHFGCIYVARKDDRFFDCMKIYQQKKSFYSD